MTTARERSRSTGAPHRRSKTGADTYVYLFAAVAGQPSPRLLARLPALPEGGKARTVPLSKRVSLVVGDVPSATYRPDVLEPRLADGDWVAKSGAAHHAVAEALSRTHAVLPFRIFTIFSSDARMLSTLTRSKARITKALDGLTGRDEWVLRIGPPDPSIIASPIDDVEGSPQEVSGTHFLQRKAAATRERSERMARVKSDTANVYAALEPLAERALVREIPPGLAVLLDAAFLVERRRMSSFRKALARTAQPLLDAGCKVSLTGPWPAYSFAAIA
jgi:hypothetical protein